MNKTQKIISGIVALLAVAGIVVTAILINNRGSDQPADDPIALECPVNEEDGSISYAGEEGKTALALLKDRCEVETTVSDFGEFVNSIEAVAPKADEYWSFFINNEYATVGADAYETKNGDTIKWQLETIE